MVAVAAGNRRRADAEGAPAGLGVEPQAKPFRGAGTVGLVLQDAALADGLAARLELRLDEEDAPCARRGERERRRQRQRQRDEADIADEKVRARAAEMFGGEVTRVEPFDDGDARIGAKPALNWPWPTSSAVTCAAPRSSSTCVKPPVDAPMSSAVRPGIEPKWSRPAISLSAALET